MFEGSQLKTWPAPSYIGPPISPDKTKKRSDKYPLSQNYTPSLEIQARIGKSTEKHILERNSRIPGGIKVISPKKMFDRIQKDSSEIMKEYEQSVYLIAQNRVSAFCQQLILAWGTQLYFEIGATESQGESARQLKLKTSSSKETIVLKQDASHSSTIPCLHAYYLKAWKKYQANPKDNQKPQGFVYMRDSDGYRFWNATIEMPKKFNTSVDNTIDLGTLGLRKQGVKILNQASVGKIHPEEGLKIFIDKFLTIVKTEYESAKKLNNKDKYLGLDYYKKELTEIKKTLNEDESAFERYLNVKINPKDRDSEDAYTIHQIRYKAIQNNFSKQSKIAQKIKAVQNRIFSKFKRTLPYMEEAFKELVIENAPNEEDRIRIIKFFNTPYSIDPSEKREKAIKRAKEAIGVENDGNGLKIIKKLSQTISTMMQEMRNDELSDRGKTMRILRKMRDLTQNEFSERLKEIDDDLPASRSTIGRCETGNRIIDDKYAQKVSKALDVDPVLFIAEFFSS